MFRQTEIGNIKMYQNKNNIHSCCVENKSILISVPILFSTLCIKDLSKRTRYILRILHASTSPLKPGNPIVHTQF